MLGPGSLVKGDLLFSGDVILHGRLEGTLFTDGGVLVAPGAAVDGGIHARRVIVAGICRGSLEATEQVVIRSGALVQADVETEALLVEDGARFFGHRRSPLEGPGAGIRVTPYLEAAAGNA